MASLGDLMVRVGVDLAGFKDGIGDAIQALEKAGDKANRVGGAISSAFSKLGADDTGAKVAAQMKSVQSSFDLLEKAYKDGRISADDFAKAQSAVAEKLRELGATKIPVEQFERLGSVLKEIGATKTDLQIGIDTEKLKSSLAYVEQAYKAGKLSADDFAKAQSAVNKQLAGLKVDTGGLKNLEASLDSAGNKLRGLGATLTAGITAPLVAIAGLSAKTFGDFEAQLNRVQALGGITGKSLDDLRKQAMQLGADTQFSAKQAAEGMAEFAGAGYNAEQITATMKGTLDLAAAGQIGVGEAAKLTSDILGQFGLAAGESGRVANVLAAAGSDAKASMSEMGITLTYVGPVAKQLGISMESTVSAIVALDQAGIRGEKAGTGLRGMLEKLIGPSKEAKDILDQLGIKVQDAAGKFLPLSNILEQFKTKMAGLGEVDKAAALVKIFGAEAENAAAILIQKGGPALDQMTAKIRGMGNAADEQAKILNSGFNGALERMKGSIETAGIALGEVLAPYLIQFAGYIESASNKLAGFIQWFQQLPAPVQAAALGFTALAAGIGPVVLGFGTLLGAVADIAGGLSVMSAALGTGAGIAGILSLAAPLAVAFGVALAGWAIYEAVTEVSKLNTELDRLYSIQQRGIQATQQQANEIRVLESALKAHNAQVGAQKVEIDSTGKSITEYVAALRQAVGGLEEYKGKSIGANQATKDGKVSLADAAKEYLGLGKSATEAGKAQDGAARKTLDAGKAHNALADAVKNAQEQYDKVARAYLAGKASAEQLTVAADNLRKAQDDLNPQQVLERYAKAWDDTEKRIDKSAKDMIKLYADLDKATNDLAKSNLDLQIMFGKAHDEMQKRAQKPIEIDVKIPVGEFTDDAGRVITILQDRVPQAVQDAVQANGELQEALKALGLQANGTADKLWEYYNRIAQAAEQGKATPYQVAVAHREYLKQVIEDYKAAGIAVPAEMQKMYDKLEQQTTAHHKKQKTAWTNFFRELQGFVTTFNHNLASIVLQLFTGDEHNNQLKKEEADLRASLVTREQEYNAYVVKSHAQIQKLTEDSAAELKKQEDDLAASLVTRQGEYEQFVKTTAQQIEEIRVTNAAELQGEIDDLNNAHQEKVKAYDEYARDVAHKIQEITEANQQDLDADLERLRDQLADKTLAYNRYVEDVAEKLDRLKRDTEDDIGDKQRDTGRNKADKQKDFDRDKRDLDKKIADELKKGKKANKEQIADWRQTLQDKQDDLAVYLSRADEDLADFTNDHRRHAEEQANDYRKSLARETNDYREFVAQNKIDQDKTIDDHAKALEKQVGDLNESLKQRQIALTEDDIATYKKIEGVTEKHRIEEEKQILDLHHALETKTGEWEKYKAEVASKLEVLRNDAAIKLSADTTQLETDLTSATKDWNDFKDDVVKNKLPELEAQFQTTWDKIKDAFGKMLTDMGGAVINFGITYLEGKLFKWIKTQLIDDLLPALGSALKSAFSWLADHLPGILSTIADKIGGIFDKASSVPAGGGSTPSTSGGGGGGGGIPGGGIPSGGGSASSGAGGGVMGAVNMATGVISAVADVIGIFQNMHQETSLNAIEHNTRYEMLYLLTLITEALVWWPRLGDIEMILQKDIGTKVGDINSDISQIKTIMFNIHDMFRDRLLPAVTGANAITISTDTESDGSGGTDQLLATARQISFRLGGILDTVADMSIRVKDYTALPWQAAIEKLSALPQKLELSARIEVDGKPIYDGLVKELELAGVKI